MSLDQIFCFSPWFDRVKIELKVDLFLVVLRKPSKNAWPKCIEFYFNFPPKVFQTAKSDGKLSFEEKLFLSEVSKMVAETFFFNKIGFGFATYNRNLIIVRGLASSNSLDRPSLTALSLFFMKKAWKREREKAWKSDRPLKWVNLTNSDEETNINLVFYFHMEKKGFYIK